ncbi:rhomboid family intramembrane serine protease [Xenorhabdus bovienii]|uniref:rhomboid family intramembrane serine protease n=1 Tax=Xenorhabdus bovienii TaxID=40576 RepID=UPI00237CAED4|nr:rhomboid family intramembrane serine protease [Xenorhabdus bovienii]MDE1487802.1 rhomboid family intramembrane serine protease [Xenorhabdus bovienii]MDE1489593.1 rhomboid family intramembrane serine protease [Xenorhabdus bovienii]MDE1494788.1 rhomboid family intramembrane serine protease [Xenorhabdus bovienii]MDE9474455.1 rhomboid family intramembrane serine protease [Xenorhabdus bovienii]MDE9478699.1 rhomboid family intramembrane serine protease [Xenorhabdus bovienii]
MLRSFRSGWLSVSAALTILTIVVSFSVSYFANHQLFSTVTMPVLRSCGGTAFDDIRNLELWRVITAQLIHAKQVHMLLNALCLFLLGSLVESRVGGLLTFSIGLIAGGIATAISPILIEAPWNVGTGASQATFAFAGCATVLALSGTLKRKLTWTLIAFVVLPGVTLDLIYAGYPKPGHVVGFVLRMIFRGLYLKPRNTGCRFSQNS